MRRWRENSGLGIKVAKRPKIILIFGLFRSGTSALAGLIHKGGIIMGESLLPADWVNPTGYYEDTFFTDINKRIMAKLGIDRLDIPYPYDFQANKPKIQPEIDDLMKLVDYYAGKYDVWGWKQPQTCFTAHFWLEDLAKKADIYRIITCRDINDIAKSIERSIGLPFEKGVILVANYRKYLSDILDYDIGLKYKTCMEFIINYTRGVIDDLNNYFEEYGIPQLQYADHIDKSLVHFGGDNV